MRHLIPIFAVITACAGEVPDQHRSDRGASVLVLEGESLASELARSPAHVSPEPFSRVGVLWDADRPQALELSFSVDGASWSPWAPPVVHHIELEDSAAFSGQVEVDGEPATQFRVRGAGGTATFVRVELMTTTQSEDVEDREEQQGPQPQYYIRVGDMDVRNRDEWGARDHGCSSSLGDPYRMAIHHTETPTNDTLSPEARLRQIQSYHMDVRGWCDIGYHYLVSRDGKLWEGRPVNLLGSHSGGANTGNIGISVMGSHDSTEITSSQLHEIAGLVRGLADEHGVDLTRSAIKGHREYKSTSCPGDALFGQLDEIVDAARTWATMTPPSDPPPTDPPPTDPPPSTCGSVRVLGVLYAGSDTANRIVGATVRLGTRQVVTNSVGGFSFDDVPVGAFTLTAEKAGYQTRSINRATYAAETWASFGLSPEVAPSSGTAILQGVVYHGSSSSNRIPYADLTLSTGHTTTADANGFYKILNLPAGVVSISASATGYTSNAVTRTLVGGETTWGSVRLD